MAILDIFKKKEKTEEKPKEKIPEKKEAAEPIKNKKPFSGAACRLLKEPHISEKATDLTKEDWYTFRVRPEASKKEIKKAIEELYGVKVICVRTINIPSKKRRLGRIEGQRKGYRKAMVQLKKGQKIEVLPR